MTTGTPQEQLMLELINRARMNPVAEAARFGIGLNDGLPPGTITATPKQILAMNNFLVTSSDNHTNWMLTNDQFTHPEPVQFPVGRTGQDPDVRMVAAGYVFSGTFFWGENISWTGTTGTVNPTSAIVAQHESLFRSPGHRENILFGSFREVGVGQGLGVFTDEGTNWNASMVTQNFAVSGPNLFVTGVMYNDSDGDGFYDVGEQTVGRGVAGSGSADTTGAGGGYALSYASAGNKTIVFQGTSGDVQVVAKVVDSNVKVDLVAGTELWTNTSLVGQSSNISELHALGVQALALSGGSGNQRIYGNSAVNVLRGNDGNDSLAGDDGNDVLAGDGGSDLLNGGLGQDKLTGGGGGDSFYFSNSLSSTNRDIVEDFSVTADTIRLNDGLFKLLPLGALAPSAFVKNAAGVALDANDRIIYDTDDGWLRYDTNGSAAGGVSTFAKLDPGLAMTSADFLIV